MTCPNCTAKDARIMRLEKELGVRRRDGEIGAVMAHFEISATLARLMLRLYSASGRPVSKDALMTVITCDSVNNLHVRICKLRNQIGEGLIECTGKMVGSYFLSAAGMSSMLAALEPLEMQAAREI